MSIFSSIYILNHIIKIPKLPSYPTFKAFYVYYRKAPTINWFLQKVQNWLHKQVSVQLVALCAPFAIKSYNSSSYYKLAGDRSTLVSPFSKSRTLPLSPFRTPITPTHLPYVYTSLIYLSFKYISFLICKWSCFFFFTKSLQVLTHELTIFYHQWFSALCVVFN